MSQLPYLENAKVGKNNWWRYLITIVGSFGLASIAAGILIAIMVVIYTVLNYPVISPDMINSMILKILYLLLRSLR